MVDLQKTKEFDDLCEKYRIWIIKYYSEGLSKPLFLVWYTDTDEDSTDRLLTWKSGKIFAANSLAHLNSTIVFAMDNLVTAENLKFWLNNIKNLEIIESCYYDMKSIEDAFENNNLEIKILDSFAGFVNLFNDFVYQDNTNIHLKRYTDDKLIKKAWNYYYDYIFWPRFNDKEKFEMWDRPIFNIDTKKLRVKFKEIVNLFDNNILVA